MAAARNGVHLGCGVHLCVTAAGALVHQTVIVGAQQQHRAVVALGLGKGIGVLGHLVVKGHLVAQTLHVGVVLAGLHTDAQDIFAWAAEQPYVDSEKMFLSGQSMGGYIAASCAPVIQPHGLILLCPGAGMWFGCAQRADGVTQTGKDYADMEGLCYKMAFNYELDKHPDPFTEAKGYNGPVLLLRADDDRLVDEGTCSRYAEGYTAPEVDTIAGGGHNFATLTARAAVEEKTAAFIKAHL